MLNKFREWDLIFSKSDKLAPIINELSLGIAFLKPPPFISATLTGKLLFKSLTILLNNLLEFPKFL